MFGLAHTFGLCGSKNATSSCKGDWSVLSRKAEGAEGGQEDQGQGGLRAWLSEETRMKLPCPFGRFILLERRRAPCQTVVELQVSRNTPGRIEIKRDETANVPRSSP